MLVDGIPPLLESRPKVFIETMSEIEKLLFDAANSAPDEIRDDWRAYLTRAVGGIWQRPYTSARSRSLSTVAAVTTLGCPSELRTQIRVALANGVTRLELCEIMMQVGGYAGIALAREGMLALKELFGEEPDPSPSAPPDGVAATADPWPEDRHARALAAYRLRHGDRADDVFASIRAYQTDDSFHPEGSQWRAWIMETSFADLWPRPNLTFQDRARVTIAVLVVGGRKDELRPHLRAGLNLDITPVEIGESIMQIGAVRRLPRGSGRNAGPD